MDFLDFKLSLIKSRYFKEMDKQYLIFAEKCWAVDPGGLCFLLGDGFSLVVLISMQLTKLSGGMVGNVPSGSPLLFRHVLKCLHYTCSAEKVSSIL